MEFTEKVHAFIAARFYKHLTTESYEQGKAAFIHATQYYAEQRGRRMAQRAIRDGKELSYTTYLEYGEWESTKELIESNEENKSEVKETTPDYLLHISRCPWHLQFEEMGEKEAGKVYCAHLDNSIARGFNPKITYIVEQTLHDTNTCVHRIKDTNLEETPSITKNPKNVKSFEYHCAHSYFAYSEVSGAIFKSRGASINQKVLEDIENEYSKDLADRLLKYKYTNFSVC